MIKWIASIFKRKPKYVDIHYVQWGKVKTLKELTMILDGASNTSHIRVSEEYLKKDPSFKKYCRTRKVRV